MSPPNGNGNGSVWRVIQILAGTIVGAGSVVGGIVYMISLTIEQHHNAEQAVAQAARIALVEGEARQHQNELIAIKEKLKEVETQFRAADQMRNLTHAHDLRDFAALFEKVEGRPYPIGNAYYPKVCNRAGD